MGRRGDERHTGLAQPEGRDVLVDLGAGELASLSGLGTLRELDLDLAGRHQILGGHTEAARGDLLDLGRRNIAVLETTEVGEGGGVALLVHVGDGAETLLVLASLATVALAAQAVQSDGQRLVRLTGKRAEGHAAGAELAHHLLERFNFVNGNGLAVRLDVDQVAEHREGSSLERFLEQLVLVHVLLAQCLVQQLRERRCVVVVLAPGVELDKPVVLQRLERGLGESRRLQRRYLVGNIRDRHATDARHCALEGEVHDVLAKPDRLEDLSSVVRRQQRDPDLGHDLEQPGVHRIAVVGERILDANLGDPPVLHERLGLGVSMPRPAAL
mmetsp:Transcript_8570/g.17121  ORF Transcript_8570/g.17121 Transcript_8570/m.17121 type:complete len:328 (+) Transcript_8570:1755-2738(+)